VRGLLFAVAMLTSMAGVASADPTDIRKAGIGLRAGGATAPEGHALFDWALDVTIRPRPHLGLGAELSAGRVSLVEGERSGISLAPHAEYFRFPWQPIQVYGRAGLPIQQRSGGGVASAGGLAAYGAAGVRWWPECHESGPELASQIGCMSFGLEVRALHTLSDGYLVMPAVLPAHTTALLTSLSFGLEF
jgi:hypothetical protein